MAPRIVFPRFLVVAGLALGAAAAQAQLAANSPFLPPQGAASTAPTQNAPLEYGGYITTAEGPVYRIMDPARKMGVFLKLNETDAGLGATVKQFDQANNTVTVEQQGRTFVLEEKKARIVSAGSAAPMPMPAPVQAPQPNVAPAVVQSVVLNPTPADEAKRLEAVAAEVARRRALREQAAQNMSNNPAPTNAPPVTLPPPPQNAAGRGAQPNQGVRTPR
jgi:hypothetical protein